MSNAQDDSTEKDLVLQKDFKVKAVEMSLQAGIQVKQVAEGLDIHPIMLSRRRKEDRDGKLHGDDKKRLWCVQEQAHVWSHDGKWLVFDRDDPTNSGELYVLAVDSQEEPQALGLKRPRRYWGAPNWSPDGRPIIFHMSEGSNTGRDLYYIT